MDKNCLFCCRLANARILSGMLRCVQLNKAGANNTRVATLAASEVGLRVTTELGSTLQATAFLQKELFDEFSVHPSHPEVVFAVHIDVLIECLNIYSPGGSSSFSSSSSARMGVNTSNFSQSAAGHNQTTLSNFILGNSVVMYYAKEGDPLTLIIEESSGLCGPGAVITDCKVRTVDLDLEDGPLELQLPAEQVVNKVIMAPKVLLDRVNELDTSSDFIQIEMSPLEPFFSLTTRGSLVKVVDTMDKDSSYIFSFEVTKTQRFSYRSNMFKLIQRTLQCCCKVSLRTNEEGFLCMQFMVRFDNCPKICFVEFFFAPVEHVDL